MGGDRSRWLDELGDELCRESDVEFAVVFGSRSTGFPRPNSDVDVAIKFNDDLSAGERFRQLCALSGNVQRSDAPFVDVSDLETLPLTIAARAVDGDLLCGDEASFSRYRESIEAEYADQRDDRKRHNRAVIDRIASGGLRGG